MKKIWSNIIKLTVGGFIGSTLLAAPAFAEECNEETMDAFAYEDCINALKGPAEDSAAAPEAEEKYAPFARDAYLTSSFGENRGTRYHAGLDYSTQMEEGWPIYAPEDGKVAELRTSPFGYGKVMFFKGNSGKTWVFAHQSSFGKLDEAVIRQQYATKKNDVILKPGKAYKKGDTLSFAGSTGIGNPHLHLEVRLDNDRVINPLLANVAIADTIAPQLLGAAVWQGNHLAVTPADAFNKGCVETPVKNEFNLEMAIKIVDYSRTPKDNPMSVRRITLWRYDEKIFDQRLDTLRFSKMAEIRNQLLWAEEADTAGDWHVVQAKLAPLSTYTLEVEDFNGNSISKKFTFRSKCKSEQTILYTKNQTSPLFTFLSRPMLDLFRCENGMKFSALKKDEVLTDDLCKDFKHQPVTLGSILEANPEMTDIRYTAGAASTGDGKAIDGQISLLAYKQHQTSVNWKTLIDGTEITQKISGISTSQDTTLRLLAVTRTATDSLDFWEFHPKGLQLKNWNVCIENKDPAQKNSAPLYWLGETSRNWFIFSKQNKGKKRCASTNELRDITNIDNPESPILGFAYWTDMIIGGVRQPALKIPLMFKYDGVENGNAISVKAGKTWIAAEYDSEPREIILEGSRLPEAGGTITVNIVDEAGHKASYDVDIPEM